MPAGQPQQIGEILAKLTARHGYGRVETASTFVDAWREAAGASWADCTRATQVRRGVLEVLVGSSTLIQEIGFEKVALLKRLALLLPDGNIRDLKFRVGRIE